MIITAMVAVALGGAAACANKPATPSSTTSAAAADETKAVCTEAQSSSATAIADPAGEAGRGHPGVPRR
jgi:hypothetical protein